MKKTIRIVYFAYRHSIRSGRTSWKDFMDALYMGMEVYA